MLYHQIHSSGMSYLAREHLSDVFISADIADCVLKIWDFKHRDVSETDYVSNLKWNKEQAEKEVYIPQWPLDKAILPAVLHKFSVKSISLFDVSDWGSLYCDRFAFTGKRTANGTKDN